MKLIALHTSLPVAVRWSEKGKKEKWKLLWMSELGWCIDGRKKRERYISGAEIAVVYSSTNPKFCADPLVARKQLTVKWGDQRD